MAYKRKRTRLTPSTYRTTTYKSDGSIRTSTTTKMGNQTWTESEKGRTHTVNTNGWITTRSQRRRKPRKNKNNAAGAWLLIIGAIIYGIVYLINFVINSF